MPLPETVETFLRDERPRPLTRSLGGYLVLCLPAQVALSDQLKPNVLEERRAGRWCWYVCENPYGH